MQQLGGFIGLIATVSAVLTIPVLPSPTPLPPKLPIIIQHGDSSLKEIALTFDADMTPRMEQLYKNHSIHSWYNERVISLLEESHTKATLFLTGMWAELYPTDAKTLANNPLFEIGNHSYAHPSLGGSCFGLTQIPITSYASEIKKSQAVLAKITGVTPHLFRFPGGCMNEFSLSAVQNQGLIPVGWDTVSTDAFNGDTISIIDSVIKHAHNGAIVVMHLQGGPNAPKTADALAYIIPALKKEGYTFVTVSEFMPKLSMR